jgi:aminoglycoside phosphotransferase (APT) family kinase protein
MTHSAFLAADSGTGTPPADVVFGLDTLQALLVEQHPDLSDEALKLVASGWDNWMVRIGDDLCARLPRRAIANDLVLSEQAFLPKLLGQLTVDIPVPERVGVPGCGYPYNWSVLRWLPGAPVCDQPLRPDQGPALAGFLRALHRQSTAGLPPNPARNGALSTFSEDLEARASRLSSRFFWLPALVNVVWSKALAAEGGPNEVFLHGDLHARNALSIGGSLSAIIDWGDLTRGDPMFDVGSVWHLLDNKEARAAALSVYGADDHLAARSMGWALRIALILLDTGVVDHPVHARMGLRTLGALAADCGSAMPDPRDIALT